MSSERDDHSFPGDTLNEAAKPDVEKADYEVGYGRPPVASRFKSGQIANPKGRPRGSLNLTTMLQQKLGEKITVSEGGKTKRMTKGEIGITKLVNNFAQKGDLKSFVVLNQVCAVSSAEQPSDELEHAHDIATDRAILDDCMRRFGRQPNDSADE